MQSFLDLEYKNLDVEFDKEGAQLLQQLHEHLVILAKRVAVTGYCGGMTITLNPLFFFLFRHYLPITCLYNLSI